jgi:hypothetical protein
MYYLSAFANAGAEHPRSHHTGTHGGQGELRTSEVEGAESTVPSKAARSLTDGKARIEPVRRSLGTASGQ